MLERINRYLEGSEKGIYVFLVWSFIGAVIGAVVGVVGIAFHILLEEVTVFRMNHPWILFLLPVGGLVIAGLYHLLRMQNDRGTNLILIAVRVNEKVSLKGQRFRLGEALDLLSAEKSSWMKKMKESSPCAV